MNSGSLAESGLAEANFYLGCMYEDGSNGLPKDVPLAFEQYELAASSEIGLFRGIHSTGKNSL